MTRLVALTCSLLLVVVIGAASAEDAAPLAPTATAPAECVSPAVGGGYEPFEIPALLPEPSAVCVSCTVDQQRDCDASCVTRGFLWGTCCGPCSTKCLCSGQDPADVC